MFVLKGGPLFVVSYADNDEGVLEMDSDSKMPWSATRITSVVTESAFSV